MTLHFFIFFERKQEKKCKNSSKIYIHFYYFFFALQININKVMTQDMTLYERKKKNKGFALSPPFFESFWLL